MVEPADAAVVTVVTVGAPTGHIWERETKCMGSRSNGQRIGMMIDAKSNYSVSYCIQLWKHYVASRGKLLGPMIVKTALANIT